MNTDIKNNGFTAEELYYNLGDGYGFNGSKKDGIALINDFLNQQTASMAEELAETKSDLKSLIDTLDETRKGEKNYISKIETRTMQLNDLNKEMAEELERVKEQNKRMYDCLKQWQDYSFDVMVPEPNDETDSIIEELKNLQQ